jgi:hypothetical protein
MWLTAPTLFLGHPVFESICNIFSFNSFIQGIPDLAPQRKKRSLRANIRINVYFEEKTSYLK